MRRSWLRPSIRSMAMAVAAGALVLVGGNLSAQTLGSSPSGFPGTTGTTQDESAPRLIPGHGAEIFRVWARAGDPRAGGGAVFLAVSRPTAPGSQPVGQTLLEIKPAEKGVNPRDPMLAVGPSGHLALAYQWVRFEPRAKQIRVALSTDGGKTWDQPATPVDSSGKAFSPQPGWTADGGLVVIWEDEGRGDRAFDVYARRSPDGGKTWEPQQLLSRFPNQRPADIYARPILVTDGGNRLWTVWVGLRDGRSSFYLNRSVDGGRTWTTPLALSGDGQSVFGHQLARSGDRLLLVWNDTRSGHDRIYSASSDDGGAAWTPPIRVDHIPETSSTDASSASVLLGPDGQALVAWQDGRNGRPDIFLAKSTDGGRTWGAEDQRMDTDEPGTAVSRFPKLARAKDGRVAITWEDDRDGFEAVYLRVRGAGSQAANWGPEVLATPPATKLAFRLPEVVWGEDGQLYLAWEVWDHTLSPARTTKRVDFHTLQVNP